MTQAPQLRPHGAAPGTKVLGIDLSTPLGDYRPDERRIMLRTIVYPGRGRGRQGASE